MRVHYVLSAFFLSSWGYAQQDFGPGPGEAYGTGTPTGHGGAVSPYIFTSPIFANVSQDLLIQSINSITVLDLETTSARGLTLAISNDSEVAILARGIGSDANLNGNYTFVSDSSLPTLAEAAAGLTTSQTVPSGTYRMEGGALIFGDPGNQVDLSHFSGTQIWPGWDLLLLNYSLENTGSLDGWMINVTAVPEPASVAVIALASAALLRRRRR